MIINDLTIFFFWLNDLTNLLHIKKLLKKKFRVSIGLGFYWSNILEALLEVVK